MVITGAARSGKTTVGNILGSCRNAEHFDDPWLPMMIPILASFGLLPQHLAIQMFQTCLIELFYDRILMRHVNFRPQDLSSVWRQKTPGEIFNRLMGLHSREDVRTYARDNHLTLVLTLSDTLPFCDFFWAALPGCRVIHVLRDGLDVALEVVKKGWLADEEHLRPAHAMPYRSYARPGDGNAYYLPFWLEDGAEERYLGSSQLARGLHYWHRLVEMAPLATEEDGRDRNLRVLKLADLLDHPRETVSSLLESLELTGTELTERLIANVAPPTENGAPLEFLTEEEAAELGAVGEIYERLGLSSRRIDSLLVNANSRMSNQ